ncbi:MAG: acyl-CoA/acyl-ACP dehydrogenase [Deltaproteobacteria bacterium]|nr:acyl-CoA/acyl-ACP dehydrogenase [Deltaproteobacteria bacterium]
MDLSFNEDQIEIARQARRFLDNECPMDKVRLLLEDEHGCTDELWSKMAEMGWMMLRIPESYDGMGLDLLDLCVVLIEMGRTALPGPFFSTVLLAAETLLETGSDHQKQAFLSRIASGDIRGTLALHEPAGGAVPGYVQMEARADGDGYILNGVKGFVPDAHGADFIICAARTMPGNDPAEGISLFLLNRETPGVSVNLLKTMDQGRKLCEVHFDKVRLPRQAVLGEVHRGWAPLRRVLQRAQVGLCAESVGGAQRAMEMAVEYAKIRHQFDQPIGSYQAIKHRCAQMLLEVEGSRSVLYWAAWAQDHGSSEEAELAASVAKTYCSETFRNVSAGAIQVLGGTGFTWEHDMHIYLKRAKANEVALGDPAYHREEVARLIGC